MNYFDHAASSPLYSEVLDLLDKSNREFFANPSAQHILGHELLEKINEIRVAFLKSLGASDKDSFIFSSSATESNNTVVRGLDFQEGDVILYCPADHPSLVAPIEYVAKISKAKLEKIILNKDGTIDLEHFQTLVGPQVKFVGLTHVNNQSGVINDVVKLAKIVREKSKAHIHVDAVQSFSKIKFILSPEINSVALTSHKIGGPKGIAGLFLKQGHHVKPLLLGGGQELGFRSSTEAFPLIAGFHKAMTLSFSKRELSETGVKKLHDKMKQKISTIIPEALFPFSHLSPYIFSFIVPNISSDVILRHLEMKQVFISTTSACSSKISGFNPSLMALNIPERFHKNFLRISMGPNTTEGEVDNLLTEFQLTWENLQHLR